MFKCNHEPAPTNSLKPLLMLTITINLTNYSIIRIMLSMRPIGNR